MNAEFNTDIRPALQPGDQLGYYEVRAPLAAGGLSLIWKAHDSMLNRDIAIKQVANAEQADETMRQRFRQEADLQKRASSAHQNLVQVLDCIEEERGLFIVMEYVDGSSLDRMLMKLDGPMEPKQVLGVLHQLAIGLAAIHQAGVIHRDLKPSNILLPREGGVKVCDFGLATLHEDQDVATMGTARYMAPEQFTGEAVDGRCDLYALGMIAYEMLLGKPAFEDQFKTVLRDQRNQPLRWMKWHTNERLIAQPIHKLNERVPEDLSEIIERLMDKNRDRRVESAVMLLDVLKRRFSPAGRAAAAQRAADEASAAQLSSPMDPTMALPTKSKLPMLLIVSTVLLVLIGGGVIGYMQLNKGDAHQQYIDRYQAKLDEGKTLFAEGEYTEALARFQKVAEEWSLETDLGRESRAGIKISEAMIFAREADLAMETKEYAVARKLYDSAVKSMGELKSLKPNSARLPSYQDRYNSYGASRDFADTAMKIKAFIRDGELNAAREKLRESRDDLEYTTTQEGVLDELSQQIVRMVEREKINAVFDEAERLVEEDKLAEAVTVLTEARSRMETSEFDDQLREVEQTIEYLDSLRRAEEAEDAGNLASAIRHYDTANDIKASDELYQKLLVLQSAYAYQQGRERQRDGDFDGAAEFYNTAISYHADNRDAQNALADIGRQANKAQIIKAGITADNAGDFQLAVNNYKRALEIEFDAETQQRLTNSNTRLHTQQADEALKRWDLDAAGESVEEALRHSPEDILAVRLKTQVATSKRYQAGVDEGDASFRRGEYAQAVASYQKAQKIIADTVIDGGPIAKKIEDAQYEKWMVSARAAADLRRWNQVLANAKAAIDIRDTAEARELAQLAKDALKE